MKIFSMFLVVLLSMLVTMGCTSPSISMPFGKKVKKEYFTGGKIYSEFIMDDDSGQNGILKRYGYDGHLTSTVRIKNAVKDGEEIWFDKKGRVIMKIPYVNGRKHGVQEAYYPNGDPMITTTYRNDVKNGKAIMYNKDGSIYRQTLFENDRVLNKK